ncbi:MAG: hypothetical protein CMG55_07130 [Candidatus Marinimicrobia bacterium]|nr:hypothetical protein [Candidatus Neomarinimicrobiota bacterium]|tara:strand:- start:574 stop:4554 length:3981 start_codon:yes stop_codon:yes gene_type:complete
MTYLRYYTVLLIIQSYIFGTWFSDIPLTLTQPNGQVIECFVTGDQFSRRIHDDSGFTIIMDQKDGYYYYADNDLKGGLIPTNLQVGRGDPTSLGLEPGYAISAELYQKKKDFYAQHPNPQNGYRDAPSSGTISQINVFIRFADDPEFPQPRSYYDAVFQTDQDEPSLRHYFWEVSYNSLWVDTYHFPGTFGANNTAYVDPFNRSYYQPYSGANPDGYQNDNERTQREHSLLANAINSIAPSVSPLLDIDADSDGFVDAVSFVIYGGTGDWADLLWPHRWSLYSQEVFINGARVYDYLFMLGGSSYFNVGVLCHEFGHVLGAPDYYHYSGGGAPTPVGGWDLMASNGNPPQFPSAFTKWKYFDWVEPIDIVQGGTYTLNPLSMEDSVAYKVASPYSESEYFIFEYRKQEGMYDSNAQGSRSGLLAYRVNPEAGNGNAQGPPDEFYVYRPGGDLNNNGNLNNAPYSSDYGHTELNNNTDPVPFLYNNGNGGDGGLNLYDVTSSEETISFTVSFGVPEMQISPNSLSFNLESGGYETQSIMVSNIGEIGTVLNFNAIVSGADSYTNPQGGPDGGGYFWTTSNAEPDMNYEWIDLENIGTILTFQNNDSFASEVVSLPFEFPFFEENYMSLNVNANGWIGWESLNETVWQNGSIPSPSMPRPAIFGFFDDLNPENQNASASASGNVYYHVNDDRAVIWFNDVARWSGEAGSGVYDFQFVLYPSGRFKCNYRQMDGAIDQATVGWQDDIGAQGTELVTIGDTFVSNNFSWEAKTVSGETVPWLTLSSENGVASGSLEGGESMQIYAQVIATDLEEGIYSAGVSIVSPEVYPQGVQISLSVSGQNSIPVLPFIDISGSENGIVYLPEEVDPAFSSIAARYTHIATPNGDVIPFLIQDMFTDEQVLHARQVLDSYLTSVPDSDWGSDKEQIANAIGFTNAILFLLNDESQYENPDLIELLDLGIKGQDLLSTEVFPEGTDTYMNSSSRDATYEEVLHFVHGYGIQIALPAMQNAIENAMSGAIENNYYVPLWDLPQEDYDEEYLAMGLESYFGLWAHNPSGNGYCGDNEYSFINRTEMLAGDPALFNIISGFFGDAWEYTPILPSDFNTLFVINRDEMLDYSNRSQYLRNVILSGSESASIYGNNYINHLYGNNGANSFKGLMGDDTIYGGGGIDRAIYIGDIDDYIVIPPDYTNDSTYQIRDIVADRDGVDDLFDIEELEFNGVVYQISELLGTDPLLMPTEFELYSPYPNPFNPKTIITFDIPRSSDVYLRVFDVNGSLVTSLNSSKLSAGKYQVEWSGKDDNGKIVSTGVYFVQLASASYRNMKKVLFVK